MSLRQYSTVCVDAAVHATVFTVHCQQIKCLPSSGKVHDLDGVWVHQDGPSHRRQIALVAVARQLTAFTAAHSNRQLVSYHHYGEEC